VRITRGPASLGDGGWAASVLPPGAIGELVVAGDHVCRDYFRNPRAVAENKITTADGTTWHRMGDTGYLDAEGRFWLTGRLHSTIWRDGAPVHPQLVEQAASVPGVRQAAAVGIPDAAHGEKVVLAVVPEGAGPDVPALLARLDSLGLSVDDVVVLGGSLPMDPRHNAKVDYAALRRRLGRRRR
jgi:acyl-CoA synthetase (AMP-forming)/AMP-acid ligase II